MDVHYREAAAAVAGMQETYGPRERRNWSSSVLFWLKGDLCRGHVMSVDRGVRGDVYSVRRHIVGGGTEVVEVKEKAIVFGRDNA